MRVRFNLSPKTTDVSDTKVFISYMTADWDYARLICDGLASLGFQTIVEPPRPPNPALDTERTRDKLRDLIHDSDYFCLITTYASLKSDWVAFEFKEAAALIGRVVFVCRDTPISGYYSVNHLGSGSLWRQLFIKHTTVSIPEVNAVTIGSLGIELINDPNEGWYDGRGRVSKRVPSHGLRQQSRIRQFARVCVLGDHKYRNEVVRDVIPFSWSELDCPVGDHVAALKALMLDGGRLDLENEFINGEIDIFNTGYWVNEETFGADYSPLSIFVALEHRNRDV